MNTTLKIKKTDPAVPTPQYQSEGAACFDLHAWMPEQIDSVYSRNYKVFETGLQVEVPAGYVLLIFSRSGHGFKNNIRLANCVGVIDSDYRGPLKVKLTNDCDFPFGVSHLDRIAQAMLVEIPKVAIEEVEELSETTRGEAGFGSTGAQ